MNINYYIVMYVCTLPNTVLCTLEYFWLTVIMCVIDIAFNGFFVRGDWFKKQFKKIYIVVVVSSFKTFIFASIFFFKPVWFFIFSFVWDWNNNNKKTTTNKSERGI